MFNYYETVKEERQTATHKDSHITEESVKKWLGVVLGSKEDIKNALKCLDHEPTDAMELQKTIVEIRKVQMEQTAKDSKHSYY